MLRVASLPGLSAARPAALRGLATPSAIAVAALANVFVAAVLIRKSVAMAAIVAILPLLVLLVGALVQSSGSSLVLIALALPLSAHFLNVPRGGLWPSDVIVITAVGARLARWLVDGRGGASVPGSPAWRFWPRAPTTGFLLLLFGCPMLVAAFRGHQLYGTQIIGQPMRLVIYIGIVCAIADVSVKKTYKGIVAIFYVGTVWMLINAAYYIATGSSQVGTRDLSTGGTRILSGSVAMYMASALILALLNLELDPNRRRRALHTTMVALASCGVLLGYTRAVYVGLAIPLVVLFARRRVRGSLLHVLPLCVPFLVIAGLALAHFAPTLGPSFVSRITASPKTDANVIWRERTSAAVWSQITSAPLTGVGFGKPSRISISFQDPTTGIAYSQQQEIGQDPHNGYLYLLAGGGALVLVPFLLLLGAYAIDLWRKLRSSLEPVERALLVWSSLSAFVILASAAAGTVFEGASDVLALWTLLMLPAAVKLRAATRGRQRHLGATHARSR